MPRVARRSKARRQTELTTSQIRYLLTGKVFFGPTFTSDAEVREAWEDARDELLPAWITGHPGSRCWAWWRFNAPGRRERVDGVHPFDDPERQARVNELCRLPDAKPDLRADLMHLSFGIPTRWVLAGDGEAEYEDEEYFLLRYDLMEPEEITASFARSAGDNDGFGMEC